MEQVCPGSCLWNCSGETPTPLSTGYLIESFLSRPSTLCGNLPVQYPEYAAHEDDARNPQPACPDADVKRVTASAVDITSIGLVGILSADGADITRSSSYINAIAAALGTATKNNNRLRAVGLDWKYRREKYFPDQIGGGEGYLFPKVACSLEDKDKLNVSAAALKPNLMTTALLMNGALVNYALYATNSGGGAGVPPANWPLNEPTTSSRLDKFISTLMAVQLVNGSWLQEHPAPQIEPDSALFFASAASHAVVLHVAEYALNLTSQGYLMSLQAMTRTNLKTIRAGAAAVVERICRETAALSSNSNNNNNSSEDDESGGEGDEPLLDGLRLKWSDNNTDQADIPAVAVRAANSLGTSIFIAAMGARLLGKHCSVLLPKGQREKVLSAETLSETAAGVQVAEMLLRRSLFKFGLRKPGAISSFSTFGIVSNGRGEGGDAFSSSSSLSDNSSSSNSSSRGSQGNCTVDVKQTAWLHIATNHFSQVSTVIQACNNNLCDSLPYRRSMCRNKDTISSWEEGYPQCGPAMPSYELSVYSATAWLSKPIFLQLLPPTQPPAPLPPNSQSPEEPSNSPPVVTIIPGNNDTNNSNNNEPVAGGGWQQPVIGVACAAVVLAVVVLGVRYLRTKTNHRSARLVGGEEDLSGRGGLATGYGATTAGAFM